MQEQVADRYLLLLSGHQEGYPRPTPLGLTKFTEKTMH